MSVGCFYLLILPRCDIQGKFLPYGNLGFQQNPFWLINDINSSFNNIDVNKQYNLQ